MSLIETLRAERTTKAERGEAILAAAESRDGSFTDEERVEFDGLTAELRDLALEFVRQQPDEPTHPTTS